MEVGKLVKSRPLGDGLIVLRLLKLDADDDRFVTIFGDFANLIRRSEDACEQAGAQDNPAYADHVIDAECDYLEELIGASFLVLQAKIRRVSVAAEKLRSFMRDKHKIDISVLAHDKVMGLGGPYRGTRCSKVQLIWDVGNYYKHRDEWKTAVWKNDPANEKQFAQPRKTRRAAELVGITKGATGNLRTAFEFFGVHPYSNCGLLAEEVQAWAKDVLQLARTRMETERAKRALSEKK